MIWKIELVKAKDYIERDYQKQLAYYDKVSDCLVPMFDDPLSPKDILGMEEWTQADEGFIFMDCETHKVGLIIRGE